MLFLRRLAESGQYAEVAAALMPSVHLQDFQ